MKEYSLKKSLVEGKTLFGMGLSTPAPGLVEIMGYSGLDFAFLDLEHTAIGLGELSSLILAAEDSGVLPIVRVAENDPVDIRKVLEIGAEGVIVPHVNTREDAERAVCAAMFPPAGKRGVSMMARSNTYGLPGISVGEYATRSNDGVLVIPLIEDREAVNRIEEIVKVDGVGALMLGPADLSLSMGVPGQYQSDVIQGSLRRIMDAAKGMRMPVMSEVSYLINPVTAEGVIKLSGEGVRLVNFGSAEGAVRQACTAILRDFGKVK